MGIAFTARYLDARAQFATRCIGIAQFGEHLSAHEVGGDVARIDGVDVTERVDGLLQVAEPAVLHRQPVPGQRLLRFRGEREQIVETV